MKKYVDDFEEYMKAKGTADATVRAYVSDVYEFIDFLGDIKPEKALTSHAENYISSIDIQGKTASTVNRKISSLKSFYSYMSEQGIIKRNPFLEIKSRKLKEKELLWMSEDEINLLLGLPGEDAAGLRDKAIVELMYATGLKASEVCELKLSDLDMKVGFLNAGSRSKARVVPMGKFCRNALKEYIMKGRNRLLGKQEDKGYLFLNYTGKQLTRQGLWKILKNYGDMTDFSEKVNPQVIRNTFAVHLIQNGADLKSIQEMLGHEDIMATKIYMTVSKNRIMDVYDKAFPRA